MSTNLKSMVVGISLVFALLSSHAGASLLIYPVRVSFDETERSAQVTLTNTSQQTNTYRLLWREKRALNKGGYTPLSEQDEENTTASSMIRFSPRQVTLQPGERQVIKLKLRRLRGLTEGEYRSHLLFRALPPSNEDKDATISKTRINMVLSFSIPVTVQQGEYDTQVMLKQANLSYKPSDGSRALSLDLSRKGLHSPSGNISAYWTAPGEKEILIAKVSDYNLWSELSEAQVSLSSTSAPFTPSDGRLRIHYEGVRDFQGNTYFDEVIQVKRGQITIKE
jgi:fimbrial chaperone protein